MDDVCKTLCVLIVTIGVSLTLIVKYNCEAVDPIEPTFVIPEKDQAKADALLLKLTKELIDEGTSSGAYCSDKAMEQVRKIYGRPVNKVSNDSFSEPSTRSTATKEWDNE